MLKSFSFQVSWTTALRQIVVNCYKYHGRDDLLPAFNEDDEKTQVRRVQARWRKVEVNKLCYGKKLFHIITPEDKVLCSSNAC